MQDEKQFQVGEGVEEALEILADGGKLPPDPRLEGKVPESAESFRTRMRKMTARYESQFLKRKDWEVGLRERYSEMLGGSMNVIF